MLKKRLIACLLLRDELIVQSFGFKKHLPLGKPRFPIEFLVKWNVDEIVLLDITASSQGRGPNPQVLETLSEHCFVPLTIGGGITSVDDVRRTIRSGADKVCVNTHAFNRPTLITEIADAFGCQCVVVSIDSCQHPDGKYEVFVNSGKRATGLTPTDWAKKCELLGAGEILLNSINRDGQRIGYDLDLVRSVVNAVDIPVIACGGVGRMNHFSEGVECGADAVAAANIFQHSEHSTILAKAHMLRDGVDVRLDSLARYDDREFDDNGRLIMMSPEQLLGVDFRKFGS